VQVAVTISVDSRTAIAHRVGKVIGGINATYYAAIAKGNAYNSMVLALTVRLECGGGCVNFNAMGRVLANVEIEMDTAHLATSGIGGKNLETVASWRATKDVSHSVHSQMEHVFRVVTVTGETVVSRRAAKDVPHSVHSPMGPVLRVVTGSGKTAVSRRATKDVPHSVHSPMGPVLRVVTVTGETVVSRRAQTVYQVYVASQMEIVCRAMMDIGATIVPRRAVKVAHYRHVISLTGHVHLAIMDTGGSHATFCAATGALTSVHSLMHIVRRVLPDTGEIGVLNNARKGVH